MKHSFLKTVVLSAVSILALNSCRDNDEAPADVHNHDEVQYLTVTLTNTADNSTQTATFSAEGADKELVLKENNTYDVQLSLVAPHDDHTHDVTDEIIELKEEHFFTYNFSNVAVKVTRKDEAESTRKDGSKIGLKTQWQVTSAPKTGAKANIRLYHLPTSVKMSGANGDEAGTVVGGEEDIDATFNIKN
ncbi:hypothetical protein V2H21_10790 [Riemerella anatipestifer]|uniref:hypothetical protein n=1 Tax=Riemerella anatipestifer TaxID=34085 RepID=UPI002E98DB1E|nr:hypothetical protein [Riemerella anatipestifer]